MAFSIRHKLIFAFSGLALFITLVAFFAMLFTFRAGFLQYLNDLSYESIQKLSYSISSNVKTDKEWQLIIKSKKTWLKWVNENIGPGRKSVEKASRDESFDFRHESRGHRSFRRLFSESILLLNKDKQAFFLDDVFIEAELQVVEIKVNEKIVGFVGVKAIRDIDHGADRVFFKKQTKSFIVIAIIACLLAILLAYFISHWMTAPIQRLVAAVNQLMRKNYSVKVNYKAHDEIGSLVQSFNQLGISLSEHERSQQQWIADISHELRTPLSTLRGELEAMLDGVREISIDRINSLHEDVLRLQRLVDDLHELSLSDSGTLRYQFESVNLAQILESLLNFHEDEIKLHQLSYNLNVDHINASANVYADSGRLNQLFKNLLQNSLRYTDKGGRIAIDLIQSKQKNDNKDVILVEWEDSSPGVDNNSMDKLFDRLYREEKSRNRAVGGSGLGLSICKAIVEGHGGTIMAEPSSLGGLKVRITLPLSKLTTD